MLTKPHVMRFWAMVKKVGGNDGCWEWQGSMGKNKRRFSYPTPGQPGVSYDMEARRIALSLTAATFDARIHLVHSKCKNRKCVNPDHLVFFGKVGTLPQMTCRRGIHAMTEENSIHRTVTYDRTRYHTISCRECKKATERAWNKRRDRRKKK